MTRFTLDNQTFDLNDLPEAARVQVRKLRYAQSEIARLQVIQDHLNTLQCNAYEKLCQILQDAKQKDPPD